MIDLEVHYTRVRRLFFSVMLSYGFFMWLDGPLFTQQKVLGPVGLIPIPILVAAAVCILTGDRRLNVLGGGLAIAVLLVIMALRYAAA